MLLTVNKFAQLFPETDATRRTQILPGLNAALTAYEINTVERIAAFLAQIGYESGSFRYKAENLNYTATELMHVFPAYFNTNNVNAYAHQPQKIANRVYGLRMGNGAEATGDGWRFAGRGWIQVTGRYLYTKFAAYEKMDLQAASNFAETDAGASAISGWFWSVNHNLNKLADAGNFDAITRTINPRMLGRYDRDARYAKYEKLLQVA